MVPNRLIAVWTGVALLLGMSQGWAIDEFKEVKTIDTLPIGTLEIEAAHRRSIGESCDIIMGGEALEMASFAPYLSARDRRTATKGYAIASSRRSILSVGLEIERGDQNSLPSLSGRQILQYLDDNYVIIQARVRRDLLDRKLYFHHRPFALTAPYQGAKVSKDFEKVVANAVREFHSLGVFRNSPSPIIKPDELRTLVLLFKNSIQVSKYRTDDHFEFAFVRGREVEGEQELENHLFATDKERQELVYMNAYSTPRSVRECTVLGSVIITDYDSSGIFPEKSVTKAYRLATRKRFLISEVEHYANENKLIGGWHRNVDVILDAIIDEKIKPTNAMRGLRSLDADEQ